MKNTMHKATGALILGGLLAVTSVSHAQNTSVVQSSQAQSTQALSNQFEFGKPNKFLDASDWYWPGSLLSKALIWEKKVDSHQISPETVVAMERFLREKQLSDVKVRVNQYDPKGEWRRLRANKAVGAGWRYTLGTLSWLGYTLLPNRVVGGDHFNPFTNTISLYSDVPVVALHEGGHALDWSQRKYKGTYAASYLVPFANLYHEAKATGYAVDYVENGQDSEQLREAYKKLYPAYGTYVGGNLASGDLAGVVVGAVGGHIVGRTKARKVVDKPAPQLSLQANEFPLMAKR